MLSKEENKSMGDVDNNLRVSDQNGVSQLYVIAEIYHSGRKPLICSVLLCFSKQCNHICIYNYLGTLEFENLNFMQHRNKK